MRQFKWRIYLLLRHKEYKIWRIGPPSTKSSLPKIISPSDYEVVLDAVSQYPDGASLELIQSVVGEAVSRRTLQRRLSELVKENRLVAEGRKRGVMYRLPRKAVATVHLESVEAEAKAGEVN